MPSSNTILRIICQPAPVLRPAGLWWGNQSAPPFLDTAAALPAKKKLLERLLSPLSSRDLAIICARHLRFGAADHLVPHPSRCGIPWPAALVVSRPRSMSWAPRISTHSLDGLADRWRPASLE